MNFLKITEKIIYSIFKNLVKFYQFFLSPILPARCRYYPTCSNYANQALAWHGGFKGSWLTLKRLARCQPFGGHGIDFVPLPLSRYHYQLCLEANRLRWQSSVYCDRFSYRSRLNWLLSRR